MGKVSIFFATDVHGSEVCFRKFLNAAKVYNPDLLVMGGDITGKQLIPIVEQPDGTYRAFFTGSMHEIKRDDLNRTVQILTNSGQYPYVTNTNEIGELNTNRTKVDELFRKLMLKRLENWMILANERLKGNHTKLYLTGGNDDIMEIENVLKEYESENVLNAEGRVIDLGDGHELVSTGYTNITPWHCPRDIPEEELEKKITMMAERVKNMERAVFNLHCPPYDTPLDYAPMLDENLRVVVGTGGTPKMIPVGSKTVRKSLESYQPVLSLHGHIHESRGFVKLGRTSCFNPGSEYGEGMVRGLFVMLSDKKVESYVFTQG